MIAPTWVLDSASNPVLITLVLSPVAFVSALAGEVPSERSQSIARYAVESYTDDAIATLGDLVSFETVHQEEVENAENPEFRAMTEYLANKAELFGFDFEDHGAVVILGYGEAVDRIGIVVHGDVQPADPTKWAKSPFTLDIDSRPGLLVGRGTEDDKGPLSCALYAMKALTDHDLALGRRVELIVVYTEESDWGPIRKFLASWDPPELNVALDGDYPVAVAEKGWSQVHIKLPESAASSAARPGLERFSGGSFLSQVPEDAIAVVASATDESEAALRAVADEDALVDYEFARQGDRLVIRAHGLSAHSATPWEGRNAITHLAVILGRLDWPETAAARAVRFINDLVGTGDYAEKFGDLAYSHPFMGPLTLTLATLETGDGELTAGISFRRPIGRSRERVEANVAAAIDGWSKRTEIPGLVYEIKVGEPYLVEDAPHVPVLLDIFRHYSGIVDARPVAIGGGTNARLFPNGVSFGPSMPGVLYTGHSEHEFISRERFALNLEMYTAALAELTKGPP